MNNSKDGRRKKKQNENCNFKENPSERENLCFFSLLSLTGAKMIIIVAIRKLPQPLQRNIVHVNSKFKRLKNNHTKQCNFHFFFIVVLEH